MKTLRAVAIASLLASVSWTAEAAEHLLGFGVHYWQTIDDLDDFDLDIDEEGVSFLGSYQVRPRGLLNFQFDLEYFSDGFAGATSEVISPQAFVLVGNTLYGGVGVGVSYSDDFEDDFSDPYFLACLGLDLVLLPRVHLDLNANYQADAFDELDEADSDTITLGATVRFKLQ